MLDFRVDTFLAVCRYMNFTKAAGELHITQPAVSHHIHFLEEKYGVRLFEYNGKKVIITAKFRKYSSVAQSIADHSAYLSNAMNGTHRRYNGLTTTKSYSTQLSILQKGGYCTWSGYVSELTTLIKKYNLTSWDN